MNERMVCWPEGWRDAAVASGLADRMDNGAVVVRLFTDRSTLRDALGEFAYLVAEDAQSNAAPEQQGEKK